ncbi:MAG TPA: MFS transporter [Stellaceae bacterium]|jgi:putative MFS transporter|nr:MFS transporter [Stellaceae bacterium]
MSVETMTAAGGIDSVPAATLNAQRGDVIARLERLPFSRLHLRLAAILSIGTFFDAFDAICIAVALTVIFTTLHIGFFSAGLVFGSAYAGQFAGAWGFGFLSERYGRKNAFIWALLLYGILSMATALAWNLESLVTIRVVQGLGLGGEIPAAAVLINEMLRSQKRGKISMIYQTVFQWGALLTPIIGLLFFNLFGQELGWRLMFVFGGIPALAAIYAWFVLPESPRWLADRGRYDEANTVLREMENQNWPEPLPAAQPVTPPPLEQTCFAELFSGMYLRRTLMVWTAWLCAFFVAYGFSLWLPTLYVKIGGLPVNKALALSIVPWIVNMSFMYLSALVVDRVGRKPIFVFGFLSVIVAGFGGAFVVDTWHTTSWQVLFTIGLLLGIGTSLCTTILFTYTSELYPTRMRGLGVAAGSGMLRLAAMIAPLAVGALLGSGFGIDSVFAMFGVAGLIGAVVLAFFGIETKQQNLETLAP